MLGFVTDSEFPAALRAPSRKQLASVLGCHAGAETVLVPSLAIAGLKCTFHDGSILLMIFLTELQSYGYPMLKIKWKAHDFLRRI